MTYPKLSMGSFTKCADALPHWPDRERSMKTAAQVTVLPHDGTSTPF